MGVNYFPKIIFEGEGSLTDFIEYLYGNGYKRIYVVTDRGLYSIGLYKVLTDKLQEFEYKIYSEIEPEPSIESVYNLGRDIQSFNPEVIVAFGGGSVIDAAKGGWALYEKPDLNLEEISPFIHIGTGKKAILASIPTTSGTGSEATLAVVYSRYVDDVKEKIALGSYELISTIVVLDPSIVLNLPKDLTLYTALDALTHAVESYVATQSNEYTIALAEKAIVNIFEYLPDLLEDLSNIELRRKIHVTADMAGIAFSNSGLGMAHAIGHVIGGRYGIHHGRAVSTVLPYVVKYNSTCEEVAERYEWISRLLVEKGLAEKMPFYKQLYEFIEDVGGDTSYNKIIGGKYIDELDGYIHLIFQDPDMIYNPIVPEESDIKRILEDMYSQRL